MKYFKSLVILLGINVSLHAAGYQIAWMDTLGFTPNDYAEEIAVSTGGSIYITGGININDYDFFTMKYDASGNIVWADTIDNGDDDFAYSVAIDRNNYIYAGGRTYNGANSDFLLIKYDSLGNIVWTKTLDNGGSDAIYDIAIDDSNNVYVTGYTDIGANRDYLTVKYTSQGNVVWVDTFDNSEQDFGTGIAVDENNNVYIVGYSYLSDINDDYDFFTIKYDRYGNVVWVDTFKSSGRDYSSAIAVDHRGNVYIVGGIGLGSGRAYITIKYDSLGNIVWADTIGLGYQDFAMNVCVDTENNLYVTGSVRNFSNNYDFLTVKYDTLGNIVWADTLDLGHDEQAHGITLDDNGNIYVAGTYATYYNMDMLVVKYVPESEVKEGNNPYEQTPLNITTIGNGSIEFSCRGNVPVSVILYTLDGRTLRKINGIRNTSIRISNLPRGVYMLVARGENKTIKERVIVVK